MELPDLGPNHARAIRSLLICLDHMLADFQTYAEGREVDSVIVRERNTLTPRQRRELLAEIERTRALMRELKRDLGLQQVQRDLTREIWAGSSGAWEMLLENDAKRLKRYGEMPPALATYWQERWQRLVRQIERFSLMGRRAGAPPAHGKATGAHQPPTAQAGEDE